MPNSPRLHDNGRSQPHPLDRQNAYNSRMWRKLSTAFRLAHPTCDCGRPSELVDHVVPHERDEQRFWDTANWKAMCRACHARKTFTGG